MLINNYSHMGHYGGYTNEMFNDLLTKLSQIKGKFVLSSYPSDILLEFTEKFGWYTKSITMRCNASKKKDKVEVLTANYPI